MAYTLYHGVNTDGMDRVQRGLLIGLPIIAVLLILGALIHHTVSPANHAAKNIPIVSTLSSSGKPSQSGGNGSPSANTSAPAASSTGQAAASPIAVAPTGSSLGASSTSGGSSGVIGGRGGVGGGGSSGGGNSISDCSIGQIATVSCQVPACSPAVSLQPGQKAILGVNGTCIVVN